MAEHLLQPANVKTGRPEEDSRRKTLVDRLAGISRNVIRRKKHKKGKHRLMSFDADQFGPLPPPDYYYRADCDAVDMENEEEEDREHFTPIGRNAVEMTNRFYTERNLYSYLANTTIPTEKNYYDDEEVDLSCLTQKPVGILILGKPGVGKTTLATRLAAKLHAIHICPEEVVEYYHFDNAAEGAKINHKVVAQLIQSRVKELDVLHRGYVLDGFPIVQSEEFSIHEQIEILEQLKILPFYVIMLQIQDVDLFQRRIEQKFDPETSEIYIRQHYSKFNADENVFSYQLKPNKGSRNDRSVSDVGDLNDVAETGTSDGSDPPGMRGDYDGMSESAFANNEEPLDGSADFMPLDSDVLFRLITRTEDNPVLVNYDLQQFRGCLHDIQAYVDKFDKRRVLELDAYWAPSVIFRKTYEYLESCGVTAASIPVQIIRSLLLPFRTNSVGEWLGEDDDSEAPCPDDEAPPEIDWESAMRACSVRGLVDPRFRWRISKWYNLCPVALKYGRSVIGKPELATSCLDKIYFLSSPEAVEQFIFNPRPFLLPKMPTSPVKFFVLGHPLAGKTTFAKELAFLTTSSVIDMNREMEKRYALVANEYLYKKRLSYTLQAKLQVEKENHKEWKRQERARRAAMHKWVDDYIRSLAEAEIRAAIEADRERRRAERIALTKAAAGHKLRFPVHLGQEMCQGDDGWNKFCWKDFVRQVHEGKTTWTHQELLELAWDLFHKRRLYYKRFLRKKIPRGDDEDSGEFGTFSDLLEDDESEEDDEEVEGEVEEEEQKKTKSKRRRRRNKCWKKQVHIKPEEDPSIQEESEKEAAYESSDIDPDDNETEESLRMRYPMIPTELVDIIPQPTLVSDHHPLVVDIIRRKLLVDEKYVQSVPAELYIEVLKRACMEVEARYLQTNTHGPLSGGWVVDNLMTDIEKFRGILRTPEICPDQVFLLQDRSENRSTIYNRLKEIFRKKNAPPPNKKKSSLLEAGVFLEQDLEMEMLGEGGFTVDYGPQIRMSIDVNEIQEEVMQAAQLDGVDFFQKILPIDNLTDPLQDTPSNLLQIMMDKTRVQTPAFDEEDHINALLTQHERFILEQVRSKLDTQASSHSYESYSSDAMRRHIAAEFKSLNCEMTAFIKEEDPVNDSEEGPTAEMVKEDVRVIKEYLRHSREIGAMAYTRDGALPDSDAGNTEEETVVEALKVDLDQDQEQSGQPTTAELAPVAPEDVNEAPKTSENLTDTDTNADADPNEIATPDGVRSATAVTDQDQGQDEDEDPDAVQQQKQEEENNVCPDTLTETEKANCLKERQKQKIESPKRRLFIQIRLFEEFWNMAFPVCNEQGVTFWEAGLIDEQNAREIGLDLWDKLEGRFTYKAKRISENELKEEDEEIHESLMKWGEPYEYNNPKGIPLSRESTARRKNPDDTSEESEIDSEDDDLQEERDVLSQLEGKPDLYWKTVKKIEARRCFGDLKYYCPVTLLEMNLLRKGSTRFACKFRDRLYYCGDEEAVGKFINAPITYLPKAEPKTPPPPRLCITGSPGCAQEEIALKMAKEYNICYVNFRQRMHELMKARFGRDIGPNKTGLIVARNESEKLIDKAKSGDDLLNFTSTNEEENLFIEEDSEDNELRTEEEEEEEDEAEEEEDDLMQVRSEEFTINVEVMRSLGLVDTANLKTVPIGSIERTERLTQRKWKKLTKIETHVQAFLENGVQLPDAVLDEFIAPLWREAPFDQVGFIMVGFPNTEMDVKYLVRNKFFPEVVYLMECQSVVIRNRLLVDTVDNWHRVNNPGGKKKVSVSEQQRLKAFQKVGPLVEPSKEDDKDVVLKKPKDQHFPYQTEGRQPAEDTERETWTYNDFISVKITKALKHYHNIYSKDIRVLKQALNRNNIDWHPVNTDSNLFESKRIVVDNITPKLKWRSSLFEDIVRLDLAQANALLNRGIFAGSKFQRWCPVELNDGNTAVNMWNSESIEKIPILYRRYIYFIAGLKNGKRFEENCWPLINQDAPLNTVPAVIVVMGNPKSGKTTLAKKISNRLGFVYISGSEMIDAVIKHSFVSQYGDILNEIEPKILADRPQPMTLAEEVLTYIRHGQALPKFLLFRALDLALQHPKAQYHGVVFDDYPIAEDELQEMLYRGVVPTTVIKLNIDVEEACARCQRNRQPVYNFVDTPEDGDSIIEYTTTKYAEASETTILWFQQEIQNAFDIDGIQNMEMIYIKSAEKCKDNTKKMQQYLLNVLLEKPSTLEGTCPLTSQIPLRLSPDFGFYCSVSLNDNDDLIRVGNITNLAEVVEYKGHVYVFANEHSTRKFMAHPKKYTVPGCLRTPPPEVPITCLLTSVQFDELKGHWGFLDFDPVRYYFANHHYKGLQRGDPKFCVAYRKRLYCFINKENMNQFMKKPERYWNLLLPLKIPRKTEPLDMEKITPYCYLIANGVLSEVKQVIQTTGEKRPRVPFMNPDRAAGLFMGYYFKSHNMNAEYAVRQKYRNAMFDMMKLKTETKNFLTELQNYYGLRSAKLLPERLKTKLEDFLKMETQPEGKKVYVPNIIGSHLSRETVKVVEDDESVAMRYADLKTMLVHEDISEKLEAFRGLSDKKKFSTLHNMLSSDNESGSASLSKTLGGGCPGHHAGSGTGTGAAGGGH